MQVFYEIVEIKQMNVVTRSGSYCRDRDDETEYIEAEKLIATYNTHAECVEWIFNFSSQLKTIKECIRACPFKNGQYGEYLLNVATLEMIREFQSKFKYLQAHEFFDSFKFEIKTRYIVG